MVSPEERDCYFYTKSIRALSKLSFERLFALCWTGLKISGNPVFKTPGSYIFCFFTGTQATFFVNKYHIFSTKRATQKFYVTT